MLSVGQYPVGFAAIQALSSNYVLGKDFQSGSAGACSSDPTRPANPRRGRHGQTSSTASTRPISGRHYELQTPNIGPPPRPGRSAPGSKRRSPNRALDAMVHSRSRVADGTHSAASNTEADRLYKPPPDAMEDPFRTFLTLHGVHGGTATRAVRGRDRRLVGCSGTSPRPTGRPRCAGASAQPTGNGLPLTRLPQQVADRRAGSYSPPGKVDPQRAACRACIRDICCRDNHFDPTSRQACRGATHSTASSRDEEFPPTRVTAHPLTTTT
jgi:hypothetical protein